MVNLLVYKLIISFISAFSITYILVPYCIKLAFWLGILDKPDGKLKKHKITTPYLGGLAVYLGFMIPTIILAPLDSSLLLFLFACTVLLAIGLWDDLWPLAPYQKLLGQLGATFIFIKAAYVIQLPFYSSLINQIVAAFWILCIINAYNLVDVMDGLATLLAINVSISLLICAFFVFDYYLLSLLLCTFLGSLVAFFIYNKPSAVIYLGDSGALFIGGFLGVLSSLFNWNIYITYSYSVPIIILFLPLLELGTLVLIRTYKGIPFYRGSPDHFAIYLRSNGWSNTNILLYITFYSFILLAIAILLLNHTIDLNTAILISVVLICLWYVVLLMKKDHFSIKKVD